MATVTISIGRGGNERRLSDYAWDAFAGHIDLLLSRAEATVFVRAAESIGEWEGVPEDSLTWVADISSDRLDFARGFLGSAAEVWEQDAIAFTVGETELIAPNNK